MIQQKNPPPHPPPTVPAHENHDSLGAIGSGGSGLCRGWVVFKTDGLQLQGAVSKAVGAVETAAQLVLK